MENSFYSDDHNFRFQDQLSAWIVTVLWVHKIGYLLNPASSLLRILNSLYTVDCLPNI